MRSTTRRLALTTAMALMAGVTLAACGKTGSAVTADDMSLGDPNAKVTVIEYASVACPHCAAWNNEVWPSFKAKYVDTNKVHYVFREMLVGQGAELALGASGFVMARCAGKDKYFPVVEQLFRSQEAIYTSGDMRGSLLAIAQASGMTEQQFTECVSSDKNLLAMNARSEKATKEGISSTPTFVINGKKLEGVQTLEALDAAIAAASK